MRRHVESIWIEWRNTVESPHLSLVYLLKLTLLFIMHLSMNLLFRLVLKHLIHHIYFNYEMPCLPHELTLLHKMASAWNTV